MPCRNLPLQSQWPTPAALYTPILWPSQGAAMWAFFAGERERSSSHPRCANHIGLRVVWLIRAPNLSWKLASTFLFDISARHSLIVYKTAHLRRERTNCMSGLPVLYTGCQCTAQCIFFPQDSRPMGLDFAMAGCVWSISVPRFLWSFAFFFNTKYRLPCPGWN